MMAMTKKERAEFDAALLRAETIGALRWTAPVDYDVMPPDSGYSEGWTYNDYSGTVSLGWSGGVTHGSGPKPTGQGRYTSGSQRSQRMFSTKEKALAALRHAMEIKFAAALQKVDRQIAECRTPPPPKD